jgi:asparagine synthase (glutamine-hydrolysing)
MSGIAGFFHLDNKPADEQDIDRMLNSIAHRGPDAQGKWCAGPVALGHRMLHTTPESIHEHLPLIAEAGQLVLTCDARIDNRQELITALNLETSHTVMTDSELILAAYREWGEDCPEKLLGDFVFVIWDAKRRSLFCARDHIGVKPFYYHHQPGRIFAFASEVKALLALPSVPCRLNETRVADFMGDVLNDPVITFHRDILRLPPAMTMTVTPAGCATRTYWQLDPNKEVRCRSDREYADQFRHIFTEAVKCRLRSIGPIGTALSGGVDSSTLACTARELLAGDAAHPHHAFSLVWDGFPEADERAFIQAVMRKGGITSHCILGNEVSPMAHLNALFHHIDQPVDNPFSSMGWVMRDRIREQGIRVLLDGNGGDITLSYAFIYLADLMRTGQWTTLAREASDLARHYFHEPGSHWRILWKWAVRPLLPESLLNYVRRFSEGERKAISCFNVPIKPDFAERIGFHDRLESKRRGIKQTRSAKLDHIHSFEYGIVPYGLEYLDKGNSAFGFEGRYPYFDKRLVEFCVALPREQRIAHGVNRPILRRAMADLIPDEICRRGDKGNANRNFVRALLTHDRARLEEVILRHPDAIAPYVDVPALQQVYHRFVTESRVRDAYNVWAAASLALWLRNTGVRP